jgi:hypothetical protein
MLDIIMLDVIMLDVIMLGVIMLDVIILDIIKNHFNYRFHAFTWSTMTFSGSETNFQGPML